MKKILFLFIFSLFFGALDALSDQFRGSDRNGIYPDTRLLDQWPEQGPGLIVEIEGI